MEWIGATFTRYPELAVFLVVGIGYWVGAFKVLGVGLGPVTGSLMVGLLIGALFPVSVSSTAKSILFLLFLFSIGYSVGPKFFQAMRGGGLRYVALAVVMAVTGLATAYGHMSRIAAAPGELVHRGDVIGYVGSSGLSTGPHLHYEVFKNGRPVNPMTVRYVGGTGMEREERHAFNDRLRALLTGRIG